MSTNAHSVVHKLTPHQLAVEVSRLYHTYKNARQVWEEEMLEIRSFLYATDTRTTQAGLLPFKNSTTVPKLSQIASNLLANYEAHMFSDPDWAQFEAFDKQGAIEEQRKKVEAFVRTKVSRKNYQEVLLQCLTDWVNTGMCWAQQQYVTEYGEDRAGNPKILYQGTELVRLAPQDVVFDVTAENMQKAVKIVRKTFTLGDIAREIMENENTYFTPEMLEDMRTTRMAVRTSGISKDSAGVDWKGIGLDRDGVGDLLNYMSGDMVEVLEFYGDLYSVEDGKFRKDHKIVVVDRRLIAMDEQISNENGTERLYGVTWEPRPDNLLGMGPLARIVGMQYKVDKLENLRADVFDWMANPPVVEVGNVEFYGTRGAPGSRYVVDDLQGDVKVLNLSKDALNADFQIGNTMEVMEEMAGSPRNSSGFRTPGEKTKFEVQFLDQGSNRIFRTKVNRFERQFLEPILMDIVAFSREHMGQVDLVATSDNDLQIQEFLSVSREDLHVSGKMRARGSKLFSEKANALQNLNIIFSGTMGQTLAPHMSTKKLAKAVEQLADLSDFGIMQAFIGIQEQAEAAQMAQIAQDNISDARVTDAADEELRAQEENLDQGAQDLQG